MKTEQLHRKEGVWSGPPALSEAGLVLVFGGVDVVPLPEVYQELREMYPAAEIVMVSTAGEISGSQVHDNTVVSTAIVLERTPLKLLSLDHQGYTSYKIGTMIREGLEREDLAHILILSEGTITNGDELVRGVSEGLRSGVLVTGGLAADAGRFTSTYVGVNEPARPGRVAAIGFYGSALQIGHGSQGGWDAFGPTRVVTHAEGNELFSLDNINALELYKNYLGDRASELPGAALLFPLCILQDDGTTLVRTILRIDESRGTMIFAGDVPTGARVRFMMANFDRLVDGASQAATDNADRIGSETPELVLMISCVGRKVVLGQRVEEEVESVVDTFGRQPVYTGFYSNGEISPVRDGVHCSLHNQTMTITSYRELNG